MSKSDLSFFDQFNKLDMPRDAKEELMHVTNVALFIRRMCEAIELKRVSQSDCLLAASLLTAARISAGKELNAIPAGDGASPARTDTPRAHKG